MASAAAAADPVGSSFNDSASSSSSEAKKMKRRSTPTAEFGVLYLYDVTSEESFQSLQRTLQLSQGGDVQGSDGILAMPKVVVGTKADSGDRLVTAGQVRERRTAPSLA